MLAEVLRKLDEVLGKLDEVRERLDEAALGEIQRHQMDQLGHRLVYDVLTGACLNLAGVTPVDPALLDEHGYQCRLPAKRRI